MSIIQISRRSSLAYRTVVELAAEWRREGSQMAGKDEKVEVTPVGMVDNIKKLAGGLRVGMATHEIQDLRRKMDIALDLLKAKLGGE